MNEKEIKLYICIKDFHMHPNYGGNKVFTAGKVYPAINEGLSSICFEDDVGDDHWMSYDEMGDYLVRLSKNIFTSLNLQELLIYSVYNDLIEGITPKLKREILKVFGITEKKK